MAEYFREQGKDVLIVYDDLSKHAAAYRALSLLIRRPPDVKRIQATSFTCIQDCLNARHALHPNTAAARSPALPIIETQAGDVSAYIPTNVISITDGQIFLETEPVPLRRYAGDQSGHFGQPCRRQRHS